VGVRMSENVKSFGLYRVLILSDSYRLSLPAASVRVSVWVCVCVCARTRIRLSELS
jgi:hypothetical protein